MSHEPENTQGRGARKREARRHQESEREALRWFQQPGVLVFFVALVLAGVGLVFVVDASRYIPYEDASLGGLDLHLQEARWILDQMDHGENFQKPSVMMPDMPDWGLQRVTLDLAFRNASDLTQIYDGQEFFLVPELGDEVPPMGAQVGRAILGPGQTFNTALHFDFDTRLPHGKLRVAWRRAGETAYLPVPEPAEHYHLRPRGGEVSLPPDARLLLPIGLAKRGEQLYAGVYGCIACHGDPAIGDSNNVGPHLGEIGAVAARRIDGVSAEQYIYDSMLQPGAFIAPDCKHGPCMEPTAMPEYASLMNLQDFADLLVYLLELEG